MLFHILGDGNFDTVEVKPAGRLTQRPSDCRPYLITRESFYLFHVLMRIGMALDHSVFFVNSSR